MTPEQHVAFPVGSGFLNMNQTAADQCSSLTDQFIASELAGRKLPETYNAIGNVLSIMYRLAACAWGCKGGDHQVEWLIARIVNQSISAHRLVRAGYYDEAFSVIRGLGEMANLLSLFFTNKNELDKWKAANGKVRMAQYSPQKVRNRLKVAKDLAAWIDDERYWKFCELAVHPTPGLAPNHYSGSGRPVLGVMIQPAGVDACITELGYALSISSIALIGLVDTEKPVQQMLFDHSAELMSSLGSINVMSYQKIVSDVVQRHYQSRLTSDAETLTTQ